VSNVRLSWKYLVQVQQCVGHKWTCLYLKQLILENAVHGGCLSIETFKDGVVFSSSR
jgi:nonsense-mediated mRNA decay protein 3